MDIGDNFDFNGWLLQTEMLTVEELGAYFRLALYAKRAGGKLPDDDYVLSRLAGMYLRDWQRVKQRIDVLLIAACLLDCGEGEE